MATFAGQALTGFAANAWPDHHPFALSLVLNASEFTEGIGFSRAFAALAVDDFLWLNR